MFGELEGGGSGEQSSEHAMELGGTRVPPIFETNMFCVSLFRHRVSGGSACDRECHRVFQRNYASAGTIARSREQGSARVLKRVMERPSNRSMEKISDGATA